MDKNDVVLVNARKIINERGLKLKAVAQKTEIPVGQFYSLLNGKKQLSSDYTLRIANALSITPNDLFGLVVSQNSTQAAKLQAQGSG